MALVGFDHVRAEVARRPVSRPVGRVASVASNTVELGGLAEVAALGDRVAFSETGRFGEIVGIQGEHVTVLPEGPVTGLALGQRAALDGPLKIFPDDSWIGRVIDPVGKALDERPLLTGLTPMALDAPPPTSTQRRALGARVNTGLSLFNTILPIVRGQRVGLFSGSGVGKSTLLAMLSQRLDADVVVLALVGERGREVREFIDRVLGPDGLARSVVVVATADQPALMRRRCAQTAMAVAEYFRDQGKHVLFLCDSITRIAESHREVALVAGEPASMGGFPPSTTPMITGLSERAGPGIDGTGDITAVLTVLVAGSNMEGHIADTMRGVLDGHVVLDREIAERGRFPAVDVLRSVSRALPHAASPSENTQITAARAHLGAYSRAELMIQAGLYEAGSDPSIDAAIRTWPALDTFAARPEHEGIAESFAALQACLDLAEAPEETLKEAQDPAPNA